MLSIENWRIAWCGETPCPIFGDQNEVLRVVDEETEFFPPAVVAEEISLSYSLTLSVRRLRCAVSEGFKISFSLQKFTEKVSPREKTQRGRENRTAPSCNLLGLTAEPAFSIL